jgi:hypothetical protein
MRHLPWVRSSLLIACLGLPSLSPGSTGDGQPSVIAHLPPTTRAQIIARAKEIAGHVWQPSAVNLHASCSARYVSDWKAGQSVTGLPYNWGGADDVQNFDKKLARGLAAGAHSRYGVLSCTAGTDCSGFVTYCWGVSTGTHNYSTSNLRSIAAKPKYNWFNDMKPGDALNKAGSHVVLFTGYNTDGTFNICEASGRAARVVCHKTSWSLFKGYIPLQYKGLDD